MIQNDQFEEVLKEKEITPYMKAYSLYKLDKINEAIEELKQIPKEEQKTMAYYQLAGQIYYKKEDFQESAKNYEQILQLKTDDVETLTNISASFIQSKQYEKVPGLLQFAKKPSFELLYNIASSFIGQGKYEESLKYLKESKNLLISNAKDEEMSEEDLKDEMTILKVQEGYVKQLLGKKEEAKEIYTNILKEKSNDFVSLAIAGNNLVTLRDNQDMFDSAKKLKFASSSKLQGKILGYQNRSIQINNAILLMNMDKYDECKQVLTNLKKLYPDSDIPALLISSMNYREKNFEEAINILQEYKTEKSLLQLSQMQLIKGNVKESIEVLEKLSIKYEPSVVAAICSLNFRLNQMEKANDYLNQSTKFWENKNEEKEKILLLESAKLKMRLNKFKEAAENFEKLVKLDPKNVSYLCGLITVLSEFDIEKAENISKMLPNLQLDDINPDKLEKENISDLQKKQKSSHFDIDDGKQQVQGQNEKKKRKKKKHPNRKPKIEEKFQKKKKNSKVPQSKMSQGSQQKDESSKLETKLGEKGKKLTPQEAMQWKKTSKKK